MMSSIIGAAQIPKPKPMWQSVLGGAMQIAGAAAMFL